MDWLAVADDLTGACDLAGNLARPGRPVQVVRQPAALHGRAVSAVLDAATRFLPPAAARAASARAWASLPTPTGAFLRFQKIDSTLRGQPGAEIEGFLQASSAPWIAVLPAYPSLGRQVLQGRVHVHGRPLARTEYARDPLTPARQERVAGLFPRGLGAHAPLKVVQGGSAALASWLKRRPRRARFISFDCATPQQVDRIAAACLAAGGRHFAGASALGAGLALRLNGPAAHIKRPRLPFCLVLGSVSRTAFEQLAEGQRLGAFQWAPRLRRHGRAWSLLAAPQRQALRQRLRAGASVALSSLASRDDLGAWQKREGRGRQDTAERALRALVKAALSLAPLERCCWFLAGGHTLASFCEEAGFDRLEVLGQLQLGVPLSRAHGRSGSACLASRPGGFGGPDDLARLVLGARA